MQEYISVLGSELEKSQSLWPELLLLIGSLLWLVPGFVKGNKTPAFWLFALVVPIVAPAIYRWFSAWTDGYFAYGALHFPITAKYFYGLILAFSIVPIIGFSSKAWSRNGFTYQQGFFYITAIAGALFALLSSQLLLLYLSIEVLSFSSYFLAASALNKNAAEAGLKYLLQGAAASACMLYGISWLYGITGSLNFTQEGFAQSLAYASPATVYMSLVLIMGGITFKLSAFPLHVWVSNVYEAAPMPVVAFLSVVPKVAMLGVLWHLLPAFYDAIPQMYQLIGWVAIASITVGNVTALVQKLPIRTMAYSTVSQSGYLLLPLLSGSELGYYTLIAYILVYSLANFGILIILENYGWKNFTFTQFAGMAKIQLWPMLALLVFFLSLVGLPPTLGFLGKAGLFLVLAEGFQSLKSTFYLWMGILALLNAAVALFYYMHIPYQAWLKPAAKELPVIPYSAKIWWPAQVLVIVFVIVLIGGFFYFNWL